MKKCNKCGEILPLDFFYYRNKLKGYLDAKCKFCRLSITKKYRLDNPDYAKNWNIKKRKKKYDYKNKIRNYTRIIIKKGKIKKHCCRICGSYEVEAHHENYLDAYNVKWFCRKHHSKYHRRLNLKILLNKIKNSV